MEGAEAKRAMEHMAKKMKDIDFKPKDDTIASLLYRRMMEEEGMDEELAKELSQGNPLVKSPKKEAVLKPKDSPPKEENKPEPVPEIKTIKVAQKSTLIKAHVLANLLCLDRAILCGSGRAAGIPQRQIVHGE